MREYLSPDPGAIQERVRKREAQLLERATAIDKGLAVAIEDNGDWSFVARGVFIDSGEKFLFIEDIAVLSEVGGKPTVQEHRLIVFIGQEFGDFNFAGYHGWTAPITGGSDLEDRQPIPFLGRVKDLLDSGLTQEEEDGLRMLRLEIEGIKAHGRSIDEWPQESLTIFAEMLD